MLKNDRVVQKDGPQVFELRGYFVMLASDVARIFEVETRIIVQNIKRNNIGIRPLFPEHYAFPINTEELDYLRSLGVISKPRDIYERRQSELESARLDQERKVLENLDKKTDIVERLLEMHNKLEPNSIVKMVGQFITHQPKLES